MNKRRNTNLAPAQIGLSLILVIFIVLCLVIFATLSLVTANQEEKHASKVADNVSVYYQADSLANEKLEEISTAITDLDSNTSSAGVVSTLESIDEITIDYPIISYAIPISDDKELSVVCEVQSNESNKLVCKITTWEERLINNFSGNDTLPLLNLGSLNE